MSLQFGMRLRRYRFLLFCLVALPTAAAQIDVEAFGALSDGKTDNSAALSRALTAMKKGDALYLPCRKGNSYLVKSPLDLGRLNAMTMIASATGCELLYSGSKEKQAYAFSLVGAETVDIRNVGFHSLDASTAPQTILLLGLPRAGAQSGAFLFDHVRVEGYATKAAVYSIGSEEDTWIAPTIIVNGGGALYAFYTSSNDDLAVAHLPSGSNLSIWMQNFHISDYSPDVGPTHALVYDNGFSSGAGNHTYRDGYLSSRNGTAFAIGASRGFTSWIGLTIDSNRFESGYQMFNFTGGGSFGNVSLTNNSSAGASRYLINLPTTCYNCTFEGNNIGQGDNTSSAFGSLANSQVSENYPFTIASSTNSYVFNRTSGTVQMPSSSDSSPACTSATEGRTWYSKGSRNSNGSFKICQNQSGDYRWINH